MTGERARLSTAEFDDPQPDPAALKQADAGGQAVYPRTTPVTYAPETKPVPQVRVVPSTTAAAPPAADPYATAAVIKNIPFHMTRDSLVATLKAHGFEPTALNYHLDASGVFRGLAFANFQSEEETQRAIASLNGLQLGSRALRVEPKKRHIDSPPANPEKSDDENRAEDEQLRAEIHAFVDSSRDEYVFPPHLTNYTRRKIHFLAEKQFKLGHYSRAEGEGRVVVIHKQQHVPAQGVPLLQAVAAPRAAGPSGPVFIFQPQFTPRPAPASRADADRPAAALSAPARYVVSEPPRPPPAALSAPVSSVAPAPAPAAADTTQAVIGLLLQALLAMQQSASPQQTQQAAILHLLTSLSSQQLTAVLPLIAPLLAAPVQPPPPPQSANNQQQLATLLALLVQQTAAQQSSLSPPQPATAAAAAAAQSASTLQHLAALMSQTATAAAPQPIQQPTAPQQWTQPQPTAWQPATAPPARATAWTPPTQQPSAWQQPAPVSAPARPVTSGQSDQDLVQSLLDVSRTRPAPTAAAAASRPPSARPPPARPQGLLPTPTTSLFQPIYAPATTPIVPSTPPVLLPPGPATVPAASLLPPLSQSPPRQSAVRRLDLLNAEPAILRQPRGPDSESSKGFAPEWRRRL